MIKRIPIATLKTWKENFSNNEHLPVNTQSAAVSLDLLKKYIAEAEKDCPDLTGFRLYFIRYDMDADLSFIKKAGKSDMSQVSLVFVPEKTAGAKSSGSEDYILPGDHPEIFALTVCQPTKGHWNEATGLCPPKCYW